MERGEGTERERHNGFRINISARWWICFHFVKSNAVKWNKLEISVKEKLPKTLIIYKFSPPTCRREPKENFCHVATHISSVSLGENGKRIVINLSFLIIWRAHTHKLAKDGKTFSLYQLIILMANLTQQKRRQQIFGGERAIRERSHESFKIHVK